MRWCRVRTPRWLEGAFDGDLDFGERAFHVGVCIAVLAFLIWLLWPVFTEHTLMTFVVLGLSLLGILTFIGIVLFTFIVENWWKKRSE